MLFSILFSKIVIKFYRQILLLGAFDEFHNLVLIRTRFRYFINLLKKKKISVKLEFLDIIVWTLNFTQASDTLKSSSITDIFISTYLIYKGTDVIKCVPSAPRDTYNICIANRVLCASTCTHVFKISRKTSHRSGITVKIHVDPGGFTSKRGRARKDDNYYLSTRSIFSGYYDRVIRRAARARERRRRRRCSYGRRYVASKVVEFVNE